MTILWSMIFNSLFIYSDSKAASCSSSLSCPENGLVGKEKNSENVIDNSGLLQHPLAMLDQYGRQGVFLQESGDLLPEMEQVPDYIF